MAVTRLRSGGRGAARPARLLLQWRPVFVEPRRKEPLDVLPEDVDLDVHAVAGFLVPSVVDVKVCGMTATSNELLRAPPRSARSRPRRSSPSRRCNAPRRAGTRTGKSTRRRPSRWRALRPFRHVPATMCPPRRSPAASARSRFTPAPGPGPRGRALERLGRDVEEQRLTGRCRGSTVRQTPETAMLSPTATFPKAGGRSTSRTEPAART